MQSVRIQTGDEERIEALILDGALDPLTGKSDILLSIRRVSDGFWLDFNDDTFKSTGWTTRQLAMTETDATNDPGAYHYDFDTSAITNAAADDTYQVRVDQSPGTDAANVPLTGEIKVGHFVDDIDQAISVTESNIRGADSDDLKDLSDQIDGVQTEVDGLDGEAMRGTDGVPTNPLLTNDARLDNLDATISSRSSHSADDVWTVTVRTLTSYGTLVADVATAVWGHATRTLTSFGTLIADIWGYATRTLTDPDSYKADVSGLATEANATANRTAIIGEIDANEVKIDSIISLIGLLNDLSIADVQTAMDNQGYTAVRAALLDNLDAAISSITTLTIADVQTALDNQGYTAARALLLDNLDATVSSRASEANATTNTSSIITQINNNEAKIDGVIATLAAMTLILQFIEDIEGGDWERDGTQMIFRKPGGAEVARFNLFKFNGDPAGEADEEVAKRERV